MEIKKITDKLHELIKRYKYACIVLLIGLALMLIPTKQSKQLKTEAISPSATIQETLSEESLVQILQSVEGAGKVKVLLSIGAGEETVYQTDTQISTTGENNDQTTKTVIITDSQRSESGLIRQVNPVAYKGAIVVCQGADSPSVRLAVTQAVSKITGLGTDSICVLKMQ
ncbi:MAG: hypothetical protein IKY18_03100 [Oscillospiraceae bacterium]|nr:hypothetical protein [Oscillospiraceae bacterium]